MTKSLVIETGDNTALPEIIDSFVESIAKKADDYFGIDIKGARTTKIYTIQEEMSDKEISLIVEKIFQKPTTTVVVNGSLVSKFRTAVWWGLKLGVKDNEGEVAKEAIEETLERKIGNVYVSQILYLESKLEDNDLEKVINLIANSNVERWEIIPRDKWNLQTGIGPKTSEVRIGKKPEFKYVDLNVTDEEFIGLNDENNWALGVPDFHLIKRSFYGNQELRSIMENLGLKGITDVTIECLAQTWSDHCSHRTTHGLYQYADPCAQLAYTIDDPFNLFIKGPTEMIAKTSSWVTSVLVDNAGTMYLDAEGNYVVGIKVETHNSPSWKDPHGGAYTGIVGVFRDPLGTGISGLEIMAGLCGFGVAPRDYSGLFTPDIHPRQIHDGIIAGIRDGGNKHGIPTIRQRTYFDESYLGKGHVFAGAIGISPRFIQGKPLEDKTTYPDDLVVIFGGRTGIDGIHGVTEASMSLSEKTTMGHVQKGDAYLQRRVGELIKDAGHLGIFNLVWDLGGGGLSSAVTETARFSGGIEVHLNKILLKYQGLDWWQVLVSESQERMLGAISPERIKEFQELAKLHDVEVSIVGTYTDSGAVHILAEEQTCAWLPLSLLHDDPPQWQFNAVWISPEQRLHEPVISEPKNYNALLCEILNHENVCSTEWVMRQFDHRVKGQTVIPPLIGRNENVEGPASVIRPILERNEGISVSEAVNPRQSIIDPYWMTINIFDKALRSITAASGIRFKNGRPERVGMLDNYCWPEIRQGQDNPDAEYKAAQLIRSLQALKEIQEKTRIPLLSGKDSVYIDGWTEGKFGEKHRISGLPCLQATTVASVDEVEKCLTPEFKCAEDLICIVGLTKNELGASIFYQLFKYVGLNIPKTDIEETMENIEAISLGIDAELFSSVQPIIEGGFIEALAEMAIGGNLGATVDIRKMPISGIDRNSQALFSETGGRFIVTFNPRNRKQVERILEQTGCHFFQVVGSVTEERTLIAIGLGGKEIINIDIEQLEKAYTQRFGDLL